MKARFQVVFLKELRETMRDRRTLGLLALFTLMYPVMLGYMLHQLVERAVKPERDGIQVAVIGAAQAPNLMVQLKQKNIAVQQVEPMDEAAIQELLRSHKVAALLRIADDFSANYQAMRPARIELWFDSGAEFDARKRDVDEVLQAYSSNIAGARLLAHGVSPAALNPIQLQHYDTGTNASRSAGLIGSVLAMLFMPAFLCGVSAAIDSTAGERERRSLEVLMAQPARTWELVTGKWLAAATPALAGLTLELVLAHAILSWLPLEEAGLSWSLSWRDLALVCLVSLPLSLFAAGLQVLLSLNSKSFKEAQGMLTFAMLLPFVPGLAVSIMDLKTASWMYLVPMLSNQTLLRELAKGTEVDALAYLLTFAGSALPALATVALASWRMKSERFVLAV
ncbi:ABC transporter permease [Massilia horti]|uniref:ABC transporter permease n=1 Tax=Massilia horti TaxID=2562153 RepID=A0A4Y9T465_9BURK|nr:ABC transporter permease [Massilia horti]TFW34741.1 ABC transporter permease [Massilia horti]